MALADKSDDGNLDGEALKECFENLAKEEAFKKMADIIKKSKITT